MLKRQTRWSDFYYFISNKLCSSAEFGQVWLVIYAVYLQLLLIHLQINQQVFNTTSTPISIVVEARTVFAIKYWTLKLELQNRPRFQLIYIKLKYNLESTLIRYLDHCCHEESVSLSWLHRYTLEIKTVRNIREYNN